MLLGTWTLLWNRDWGISPGAIKFKVENRVYIFSFGYSCKIRLVFFLWDILYLRQRTASPVSVDILTASVGFRTNVTRVTIHILSWPLTCNSRVSRHLLQPGRRAWRVITWPSSNVTSLTMRTTVDEVVTTHSLQKKN